MLDLRGCRRAASVRGVGRVGGTAGNTRSQAPPEPRKSLHMGFDRVSTPCHSVAVITKRHPSHESTVSPRPRLHRDSATVAIVGSTSWKRLDAFHGEGSVDSFDVAHAVTQSNSTAIAGDVERRGTMHAGFRTPRSPHRQGVTALRPRFGPHSVTSGNTRRDRCPHSRPEAGRRRPTFQWWTCDRPHPSAHVEVGGIVSGHSPC
jgi:hypothetical protein